MVHRNGKAEDVRIAYLGGGSRGWAWFFLADLALEPALCGTVRLYDIDRAAAAENADVGNALGKRPGAKSPWRYVVADTLEEALEGADVVILSILPGTFEEMRSDVHLPEEYGILQAVGDTVGPAGLLRALRTIPIYARFAERIRAVCPKAWVINYTNPMTLCTRTLFEAFPEIRAVGNCHGVLHVRGVFSAALRELRGIEVEDPRELRINVLGINHFTWVDSAHYRDIDLLPLFMEFARRHWADGYEPDGPDSWKKSEWGHAHRVMFDVSLRYGIVAAISDRHLAEFLPPWYLRDDETVARWKFHRTPVDTRIRMRRELDVRRRRVIAGEEPLDLKPSGEEGVAQIKALLGFGDFVTNCNLPNRGQIEGIPLGAVVETNAYFSSDGIRPVHAGRMPAPVLALTLRHVLNQETLVRAALAKDKELAFQVFLNDPLVTIPPEKARELFDRMLRSTREYLPGWDLG